MEFSRAQLKKGLKEHLEQVEAASREVSGLLSNPEYRTAACILSIMNKQDSRKSSLHEEYDDLASQNSEKELSHQESVVEE